jgi:nitrate reductase NapE component
MVIYLPLIHFVGLNYFFFYNVINSATYIFMSGLANQRKFTFVAFWYFPVIGVGILAEMSGNVIADTIIQTHYNFNENWGYHILGFSLGWGIQFFGIFLLRKLVSLYDGADSQKRKWNNVVVLAMFIFSVLITMLIFGTDPTMLTEMTTRTTMSLLVVAVLVGLSLYYLKQSNKHFKEHEQLQLQKNVIETEVLQFKQQSEMDKKLKVIRHDLRNHFLMLNSLLENKEYEEAKKYLQEQISPAQTKIKDSYSENAVLNYFLIEKKKVATEKDIEFEIDTRIPSDIDLPLEIFSVILGNALDNAINASIRLPDDSERKIYLKIRESNSNLIIKIKNYYDSQEVETRKIRKQKDGIGRKSIQEYVARLGGMYQEKEENNTYEVDIILFNQFPY